MPHRTGSVPGESQTMALDDTNVGFMGGILGRARKMLFGPDVDDQFLGLNESVEAEDPASSSAPSANNTPKGKKSNSRGARRARLAASNSSLANIASAGSSAGSGALKAKARSAGSGALKVNAGSEKGGKENMAPKASSKRGKSVQKMDSLAASSGGGHKGAGSSEYSMAGAGVVVHRRKSKPSSQPMDCSLSVCGGNEVKRENSAGVVVKPGKGKSAPKEEEVPARNNSANEVKRSSLDSLANETVYTMAEIESSFVEKEPKRQSKNRRGRGKQPVSSLVQESEPTKAKSKRSTGSGGLSSLMAMPGSTQKTQKIRSPFAKKATRKKRSSGKATKDQPADEINVASLSNDIGSLKLGEDRGTDCSTPLAIRRRARKGGITSPPGYLHRHSTLSASNIFGRSPLPDSNPSQKKRFDSKKTPDKMTALAGVKSPEKMDMSPNPYSCKPLELNVDAGEWQCDGDVMVGRGGEGSPSDDISMACASPRVTLTSASFLSSPRDGNSLLSARSNLFSVDEMEVNSRSERRSGSAVIAVEAPTPRDAKDETKKPSGVSVRGSAVLSVVKAAPIVKKESKAPKRNGPKAKKKGPKAKVGAKAGAKAKKAATRPRAKKQDAKENSAEPTRRSGRQAIPTDRLTVNSWKKKGRKADKRVSFGVVADEIEEPVCDAAKEEPILAPPLESTNEGDTKQDSADTAADGAEKGQWSETELRKLREAQKEIDPTSTLFWQKVAVLVGTKSSAECQIKWQSMVATPKVVRRPATKKDAAKPAATSRGQRKNDLYMSDDEDDDDLFNSSPYREEENGHEGSAPTKFSTFGGSSFGFSPFVKAKPKANKQEEKSALKFRRKGYNSYIENLRKDITRNKKKAPTANPSVNAAAQISADTGNAESQMSGKLLADGTVTINEREEDLDEDDIWGGGEEDEEE
ncbi:hypothetical protein ACHAXT_001013 [Thalassiosira profunda]